jgi:stage II sporulation protein M
MARHLKRSLMQHIKENSSIYIFTAVLFVMGVIFGAIIVNSLSYIQKNDLFSYLSRFFGQVSEGEMASAKKMFYQSFMHNAKFVGLMWILGVSIIGLPIILILLFLKGIVVGFTVGFLVNQLGWYGFLLSFVSVMPQNFILIPAFIVVGATAVMFSLKMIRQQFIRRVNEPIFPYFARYTIVIVVVMVCIGASSVLEAYVSPGMMRSVIQLFHT